MFETRSLSPSVERVRERYAPDAVVLDVDRDFETLPPEAAEELGLLVDRLDPATHPTAWVPDDAPRALHRYASTDFTVGMPGDGTVVWTRQTEPPTVLVKRRATGTPDDFLAFLLAAAFVEIDAGVPETFLPFFRDRYPELADATGLDPADTYQLAAALFDAWVGVQTNDVFADWGPTDTNDDADDETHATFPELFDAWVDAGDRLEPRLDRLAGEVARGETSFPAATEYACSTVRHGLALPAPFSALNTAAYRDHGAEFAVEWARKTFAELDE